MPKYGNGDKNELKRKRKMVKLTACGFPFGDSPGVDIPEGSVNQLKEYYKKLIIADPEVKKAFISIRTNPMINTITKEQLKKIFKDCYGDEHLMGMSPQATEELMNELIDYFMEL